MRDELEAIALLVGLSLPPGYRVREVEGRLHLFDPQGVPVHGPSDPSLIEAYAWRHAWRHIEQELNKELTDLHAGVRSLHGSRRLRQYMRMLDAVSQAAGDAEPRPWRKRVVFWGAFAASAAAMAAALLVIPLRITRLSDTTTHPAASSPPRPAIFGMHHAPAAPAVPSASADVRVFPATGVGPHRPALAKYAVRFGEFVNRATAETMMHFIRSKGYIAYVGRVGETFWVVTRPYHTRAQAERLVGALQEIHLPAELATSREVFSRQGSPSFE